MNTKSTVLFALLLPGMAMLTACGGNNDETDNAAATAEMADPADGMANDGMAADDMGANSTDAMANDAAATADQAMMEDSAMMPDDGGMSPDGAMTGDEMSFADLDKNTDGGVTKDELTADDMLHQHFDVADADSDGKLSEAEITKHRADMAASGRN